MSNTPSSQERAIRRLEDWRDSLQSFDEEDEDLYDALRGLIENFWYT